MTIKLIPVLHGLDREQHMQSCLKKKENQPNNVQEPLLHSRTFTVENSKATLHKDARCSARGWEETNLQQKRRKISSRFFSVKEMQDAHSFLYSKEKSTLSGLHGIPL